MSSRVTQLLQRMRRGDPTAGDDLLPLVYDELKARAASLMRGERGDHTLQPTALVHEAWVRFEDRRDGEPEDRAGFLRVAGRAMRRVLVDHARARAALKRRPATESAMESSSGDLWPADPADVLAVHEALEALESHDRELAQLVELRYFAGLTLDETAAALGITVPKVRWAWSLARGWLRRHLEGSRGGA